MRMRTCGIFRGLWIADTYTCVVEKEDGRSTGRRPSRIDTDGCGSRPGEGGSRW